MKRYILDIEADSLSPTKIWCAVLVEITTGLVSVARSKQEFNYDPHALYIGHNLLDFDLPALRTLWGVDIKTEQVVDTLICSRLFNFKAPGGHSLDAWGKRLGIAKGDFTEWEAYDDPAVEADRLVRCIEYCTQDCFVNRALFLRLEKSIYSERWKDALRTEHDIAAICRQLHDNGFDFDIERASVVRTELETQLGHLSERLQKEFPPKAQLVREVIPRATKFGTISRTSIPRDLVGDISDLSPGHPFSYFEWVPFNPGSPPQVIERLNEAGWEPFEKTEGHKDAEKEFQTLRNLPNSAESRARREECRKRLEVYKRVGWKISEENLATLPDDAPEGCQLLVKWRMLSKRLQTLDEWFRFYNPGTGRIHGHFNSLGTWTARMAHSEPNQGNVPSMDSKYKNEDLKNIAKHLGRDMRGLFRVPSSSYLVGVDADSIQLRGLGHYINDPRFTEALVKGRKEDGTDAHTLNALALGIGPARRADAKTFIYAWLLGAGVGKVAKILGLTFAEAEETIQRFIRYYPGLVDLKENRIHNDGCRGYFEALDGRIIHSDEYHMLAGYLQSFEAIIMKVACIEWHRRLIRERIPFKLVNYVHDEWQTEVRGPRDVAEHVQEVQIEAIRWAGVRMETRCPLEGTGKIGVNWYETH